MQHRLVVFTNGLAYSVRKGILEIDRALPGSSWLILVSSPKRSAGALVRSQWLNLRRNGWRWIPYQAGDLLGRVLARPEHEPGDAPGGGYSRVALERDSRFAILRCADIHSADTLRAVAEFAPDLGLSIAAPILRRPLFSIPRLGTINLHKGKLPDYRGMPPAFWELWNDERSVGCTVHCVDDRLDTGEIVEQRIVERDRFATLRGLQLQLDEVGVDLMRAAAVRILAGDSQRTPQPAGGRTYRKPTLRQAAALAARLEPRAAPDTVKALAKYAAGKLALPLWKAGLRTAVAPRITVLLYHRVSDGARDNLTVGVEQFDRQMAFVRASCEPLAIEEVIGCRAVPKSKKPLVCVTFDDGYLDNFTIAAPILMRHRVPAAFFVSTAIIGTDARFPHDVRRENPPLPVMDWHQLRAMRDAGFTIGSHSMSHIDCAAEPADTVWNELVGSKRDLERELGLAEVIFAYPYGGREHMTPERLELVKKAGYSACLSAYGGANVRGVDAFNVLRRGIHWEFSDEAFAVECLGLR